MSYSVFLELQNGAFFWLALCATGIFLRYIYLNFGMGYKFLEASIACITIWLSQVVIRGPLWWSRYLVNAGFPQEVPNTELVIGSLLGIFGFTCVIRVFSEERYKKLWWKLSLATTCIFLVVSYYKLIPIIDL